MSFRFLSALNRPSVGVREPIRGAPKRTTNSQSLTTTTVCLKWSESMVLSIWAKYKVALEALWESHREDMYEKPGHITQPLTIRILNADSHQVEHRNACSGRRRALDSISWRSGHSQIGTQGGCSSILVSAVANRRVVPLSFPVLLSLLRQQCFVRAKWRDETQSPLWPHRSPNPRQTWYLQISLRSAKRKTNEIHNY